MGISEKYKSIMRSVPFTLMSVLSGSSCLAFTSVPHATRTGEMSSTARPVFSNPFSSSSSSPDLVLEEFEEDTSFLAPVADNLTDAFILALRVSTCILMVHHGIDKIAHAAGFTANVVDKFFGFLPGPGKFWTLSAAGTQIVGAALLGVGVLARPVALSMAATMVTAVTFHLLNTGPEGFPLGVPAAHSYNFELAAMYVGVLAYFSVAGAGAYSIDEKVLGGELNFYGRTLGSIFGGDEE